MAELVPVLIGTSGFVVGECFVLPDGADLVLGRSRSCDISLRRAAAYLQAPSQVRDDDHDFNTVSRRHIRVQVKDTQITVHDLSTNGVFINDEPIQQSRSLDLTSGSYNLRLGTRESFRLTRLPKTDARVVQQLNAPKPPPGVD